MEAEYREAKAYFYIFLAFDIFLTISMVFAIIGIPLGIYHIVTFLKNKLIIGKDSVTLKKGWLTTNIVEIPYSKINTVNVKKDPLGGWWNYGDIAIIAGNDISGEVFKGIESPDEIRTKLLQKIHKTK